MRLRPVSTTYITLSVPACGGVSGATGRQPRVIVATVDRRPARLPLSRRVPSGRCVTAARSAIRVRRTVGEHPYTRRPATVRYAQRSKTFFSLRGDRGMVCVERPPNVIGRANPWRMEPRRNRWSPISPVARGAPYDATNRVLERPFRRVPSRRSPGRPTSRGGDRVALGEPRPVGPSGFLPARRAWGPSRTLPLHASVSRIIARYHPAARVPRRSRRERDARRHTGSVPRVGEWTSAKFPRSRGRPDAVPSATKPRAAGRYASRDCAEATTTQCSSFLRRSHPTAPRRAVSRWLRAAPRAPRSGCAASRAKLFVAGNGAVFSSSATRIPCSTDGGERSDPSPCGLELRRIFDPAGRHHAPRGCSQGWSLGGREPDAAESGTYVGHVEDHAERVVRHTSDTCRFDDAVFDMSTSGTLKDKVRR